MKNINDKIIINKRSKKIIKEKKYQYKKFKKPNIKNYIKYSFLFIILFIIIYFINFALLFRHHYINNQEINNIKNRNNKKIGFKDNNIYDKSNNKIEEIEEFVKTRRIINDTEIKFFRKINSENILIDKVKYRKNDNPDISIILTIKNQAHCIHKALRSIQNQSFKNIEIITVLDCSLDNSTETILSYMKEDERITLINHDINEGIMKIRTEGFRKAKGKYITAVDGDDALIHKDILNNTFYIANLGNLDIVEFIGYMYHNEKLEYIIHNHGTKGIIYQPELRTKFYYINEQYEAWWPNVCRTIWGKLIKNEVLQKALDNIGPKYTDSYMRSFEDTIMVVSLYQIAQTYYLFKEPGYYYSRDEKYGHFPFLPNKKCYDKENVDKNIDNLKFINFLYENMEDNKIERQTLYHEIITINTYDIWNFSKNINSHYDMFYKVVDGIISSKYLFDKEKEKLKKLKEEIKNKEKGKK